MRARNRATLPLVRGRRQLCQRATRLRLGGICPAAAGREQVLQVQVLFELGHFECAPTVIPCGFSSGRLSSNRHIFKEGHPPLPGCVSIASLSYGLMRGLHSGPVCSINHARRCELRSLRRDSQLSIGVGLGPQIGIQKGPPRFPSRTTSVRPVGAGRGCGDGASAG